MNDAKSGQEVFEDNIIDYALSILDKRIKKTPYLINDPEMAKNYIRLQVESLENEVFGVLFLDQKNCVICSEILFRGTINACTIYPREVAKKALSCNASGIVAFHNHPSGSIIASEADKTMTKNLVEVLDLLDISLIDHLILGKNEFVSFAKNQYL